MPVISDLKLTGIEEYAVLLGKLDGVRGYVGLKSKLTWKENNVPKSKEVATEAYMKIEAEGDGEVKTTHTIGEWWVGAYKGGFGATLKAPAWGFPITKEKSHYKAADPETKVEVELSEPEVYKVFPIQYDGVKAYVGLKSTLTWEEEGKMKKSKEVATEAKMFIEPEYYWHTWTPSAASVHKLGAMWYGSYYPGYGGTTYGGQIDKKYGEVHALGE
jgi:hypothetical protein